MIPDEGYYSECEEFFNNKGIKKTSRRVKEEVDYIVDRRSKIIPHLARHFYEKGKTKFEPPYEIDSNTWDFVDDILISVGTGNPKHISRKVREKFSFMIKCIEERFSKIDGRLIKKSKNVNLFQKLEPIIVDSTDAWHVVDATEWALTHSFLIFCSLDRNHIVGKKISRNIIACLCEYYKIKRSDCPITICHLLDI
ncbi:MAG: hypothetical protein ACFFDT_29410 [Candidatus Hodarchaeota archaeon]